MKRQGANSCIKYLGLDITYYEFFLSSNFHQKQKKQKKQKGFNTKITFFWYLQKVIVQYHTHPCHHLTWYLL